METVDQIVAKNISFKMFDCGLDQKALAQATGLSRQTIYRIVTGKQRSIRPANLELIAKALGTTRAELERSTAFITLSPFPPEQIKDEMAQFKANLAEEKLKNLELLLSGGRREILEALVRQPEKMDIVRGFLDLEPAPKARKKKA